MTLIRKLVAEFVGTFFLVFFGCGAIRVSALGFGFEGGAVPVIFGLVVATMIYAVGHISGAHFNPAVTAAFASAKLFPKKEVLPYWGAQCLAAILASAALCFLLPGEATYGATVPTVPLFRALVWEAVLTFALMFVILGVATDSRAEGVMAGVAIGSIVALGAFVGGPITGASMNPARSLGPALFDHQLEVMWLYVVGPLLGAIAAAIAYQWLRRCEGKPDDPAAGCC